MAGCVDDISSGVVPAGVEKASPRGCGDRGKGLGIPARVFAKLGVNGFRFPGIGAQVGGPFV